MRLPREIFQDQRALERLGPASFRLTGGLGLLFLAISVGIAFLSPPGREAFWHAYLTGYAWFLSVTSGALFFVILQHLTRASWSVVVRRFAEVIAANMGLMAVLFLPILLFGMDRLYPWTQALHDPLLQAKTGYLNKPFFIARWAAYFLVWIFASRWLLNRSTEQDESGDPRLSVKMEKASAPLMFAYAFTTTFAAFDLLMSLDPHWYSTMFGVYFWAGGVVGFFALLPLVAWATQRAGRMTHMITAEHYHDMGKLMFAFTVFWAYIAFSQYMLIWYGNIPEETVWYLRRQQDGWGLVGLLLLFGHFVVPFLALVSQFPKRRKNLLVFGSFWLLAMHGVDLYWLVVPEAGGPAALAPHPVHFTLFLGMTGLSIAAATRRLQTRSLVPEKDPRLEESLAFENA
ncbi:MAG: quinol:cytochrome C oxidoreductase [Candidatus Eisenbacteria bacterium]